MEDLKFGIKQADIRDEEASKKFHGMYRRAKSQMDLRTKGHSYLTRVAHMQNLYEHRDGVFSEGSTQAIKRKIRSETLQRVPEGEIKTQFDKNSIEQIQIEFIFKNKILCSEFDGKNMFKNLWRTFNASYDYGYACVRTGFDRDLDGDFRTTYKLIQWNDILPAPDCDFIEEADWYMVREYMSYSDLRALLDKKHKLKDKTYNEKVVKYLIETKSREAQEIKSLPMADSKNGVSKQESVCIWTLYKRGSKEFHTFCPAADAILRTVKNYDPRNDIPLHFLVLEPDPEFPLGCSPIIYTLSSQQFADAFQTSAYQALQLAVNPPLMQFGNLSNAKIRMQPRTIWNMGTNPNNKVEKFPVETTTITQYNAILQGVQANMMKNLNVTDATIATDANVMTYSGTPQGVDQQRKDRTTTINQFRKFLEEFFCEWANHALRSYINAMNGELDLTVDEDTRRRIWDVEKSQSDVNPLTGEPMVESIVNEDKITIDFDRLKESNALLEFKVRAGSLIQSESEQEMERIQELIVPVSQMMGNISDNNRDAFESVLMQLVSRMCELSNIDIAAQTAAKIDDKILANALQATMEQVMQQQQQLDGMQQQLMQQQAPMPEEPMGAPQMPMGGPEMPPEGGMPPMEGEQPMPPEQGLQTPPEMMPEEQGGMPPEIAGAGLPEPMA